MSEVTGESAPRQRPPPPSPSLSQQQSRVRQQPPPGSDPLALGVIIFIAVCFLLVSDPQFLSTFLSNFWW